MSGGAARRLAGCLSATAWHAPPHRDVARLRGSRRDLEAAAASAAVTRLATGARNELVALEWRSDGRDDGHRTTTAAAAAAAAAAGGGRGSGQGRVGELLGSSPLPRGSHGVLHQPGRVEGLLLLPLLLPIPRASSYARCAALGVAPLRLIPSALVPSALVPSALVPSSELRGDMTERRQLDRRPHLVGRPAYHPPCHDIRMLSLPRRHRLAQRRLLVPPRLLRCSLRPCTLVQLRSQLCPRVRHRLRRLLRRPRRLPRLPPRRFSLLRLQRPRRLPHHQLLLVLLLRSHAPLSLDQLGLLHRMRTLRRLRPANLLLRLGDGARRGLHRLRRRNLGARDQPRLLRQLPALLLARPLLRLARRPLPRRLCPRRLLLCRVHRKACHGLRPYARRPPICLALRERVRRQPRRELRLRLPRACERLRRRFGRQTVRLLRLHRCRLLSCCTRLRGRARLLRPLRRKRHTRRLGRRLCGRRLLGRRRLGRRLLGRRRLGRLGRCPLLCLRRSGRRRRLLFRPPKRRLKRLRRLLGRPLRLRLGLRQSRLLLLRPARLLRGLRLRRRCLLRLPLRTRLRHQFGNLPLRLLASLRRRGGRRRLGSVRRSLGSRRIRRQLSRQSASFASRALRRRLRRSCRRLLLPLGPLGSGLLLLLSLRPPASHHVGSARRQLRRGPERARLRAPPTRRRCRSRRRPCC